MTKFRYNTLSRRPIETRKPKSIPRKLKNKSEVKLKKNSDEDVCLLFHWK